MHYMKEKRKETKKEKATSNRETQNDDILRGRGRGEEEDAQVI